MPAIPDFWFFKTAIYISENNYEAAEKTLYKGFFLWRHNNDPLSLMRNLAKAAYRMAADIASKKGKMKMKISACVIVKNEERNLPRWLNCMRQIADEMIIVDTGSDDDTKNIAASSDAAVYDFRWQDDFAAAKNYAIDKASGDWILFLDADEYFDETSIKNVRKNIAAIEPGIKIFMCQLINKDEKGKLSDPIYMVRGFRNEQGLRYKGLIHEQLFYYDKEITNMAAMPDIQVYHTGYTEQNVEKKLRRNLQLMCRDIRMNGDNSRYYSALADCYYGLGVYEKAAEFARKFIESGLTALGGESQVYHTLVSAMRLSGKSNKEIIYVLSQYGIELINGQFVKTSAVSKKDVFISACIIVKNEEKNIGQYLEHIRPIADEIILVDTGSQDNTRAAAEKAGAKICDFKWCDDFSAAKNYALSAAQGKWIIFLDADEYFPQKAGKNLITYIKKYNTDDNTDALICKLINIDADKNNEFISSFYQLRVFRNLDSIYYAGRIHESLRRNDGKQIGMTVLPDDVYILHTGYSSSIMKKKALRNLALVQKEIEKNGERPEYYSYLADCYYSLNDYAKTAYYSKKFIDSGITMIGAETSIYTRLIDALSLSGHTNDEVLAAIDLAVARFPDLPEFLFMKCFFLLRQKKYVQAEEYLNKTFTAWRTGEKKATMSLMPHLESAVYSTAGTLARIKGDMPSAINYFTRALHKKNCDEKYFVKIYNLLRHRPKRLIIKFWDNFCAENEKQRNWLVSMLKKYDKGEIFLHYAGGETDWELTLWGQKKYSDLAADLAADLSELYKKLMLASLEDNPSKNYERTAALLPQAYKTVLNQTKKKFKLE
ncbi:glycosyltransferase family 2 protein [Pectinatus haikarae]|uniref:glycosyltransferase family 2 protein n=1 Tax=Pectinatus haikarae TaxID=349096 RepID=UPI0018C7C439|nr:glycosyltransferase family 2 protein [Pectinatus haikarae]